MFWKFFKPQLVLDALFDDGWCGLGLPETIGAESLASSEAVAA